MTTLIPSYTLIERINPNTLRVRSSAGDERLWVACTLRSSAKKAEPCIFCKKPVGAHAFRPITNGVDRGRRMCAECAIAKPAAIPDNFPMVRYIERVLSAEDIEQRLLQHIHQLAAQARIDFGRKPDFWLMNAALWERVAQRVVGRWMPADGATLLDIPVRLSETLGEDRLWLYMKD